MTTTELDLTADTIDVRDIIERFEELESECEELLDLRKECLALRQAQCKEGASKSATEALVLFECDSGDRLRELEDSMEDEVEELATLTAILDDLKGNGGDEQWRGDWYPVTLIRESHFEQAMDEMVADCYEMPKDLPSFMTITLDYVALQMDYTSTEIDGATYFYR
jgi:hypothetical protein